MRFVSLSALVATSIVAATAGLGACARPDDGGASPGGAVAADIKVPRPDITLTATDGKPFNFRERTAGRLTFLEFGYTNCPDVCPVTMANLAAALANLPPSERMRIDVVFVSVDPDRDSLPVLRKWLDSFDPGFIGLTGPRAALDSAQKAVGFAPAVIRAATAGGQAETVDHAAPLLVFTADDTAHVMYPFGMRQADWARDLPRLLARGAPPVAIERAYIVIPAGAAPAALFLRAANSGTAPDTIVGIDVGDLGRAELHESMDHGGGMVMMHAVPAIAVEAGGTVRLAPGGFHGMIGEIKRPLRRGELIPIGVRFARAGTIRALATVIAYADVDTATTPD